MELHMEFQANQRKVGMLKQQVHADMLGWPSLSLCVSPTCTIHNFGKDTGYGLES